MKMNILNLMESTGLAVSKPERQLWNNTAIINETSHSKRLGPGSKKGKRNSILMNSRQKQKNWLPSVYHNLTILKKEKENFSAITTSLNALNPFDNYRLTMQEGNLQYLCRFIYTNQCHIHWKALGES